MKTFSEVIDAFGGPAKFAKATDMKLQTVISMRRRNSIPPGNWPRVIEAAKAEKIKGVHQKALTEMLVALKNPDGA